MTGPTAAERRIVALEAQLAEQERIVRKHICSPRQTWRVTLTLPVQAAQAVDAQAHKHGTTKSELIARIMEGARTGTQVLKTDQMPILPN